MESIVFKCVAWNKQRYKQEIDINLAIDLLLEETSELFEAADDVNKLDACGDITFVTIGILWKLGYPEQAIHNLFYNRDLTTLKLKDLYVYMLDCTSRAIAENDGLEHVTTLFFAFMSTFITVFQQLQALGLQSKFYEIVNIICDSNNTKSLPDETVPSHIKANIDKGIGFIPPTERLAKLLRSIN